MFASRRILFAFSVGLLATGAVMAQSTAEIVGTVTDPTGAGVARSKVIAINAGTGAARETLTEVSGDYTLTLLPPGTYNLSVEAAGFRKIAQNGVVLEVDQHARINFTLQVGQVTEVVDVVAAAPLLESQSSSIGRVIPGDFVNELPLNGRNFVSLAISTPGVNGTGFSTSGTIMSGTRPDDRRPGSELFSNGNREGANNFLYDGVDNNERLTISIVLRPAVEAVREFQVQTNLYSAELGRNSGAVVNVVSKSGTNDWHGSAFEFLRNSAMDARNFFNTKGTPFPAFRYNQFGFSLGGPALIPKLYNGKNRTFFFVDYEGFRRNQQQTLNATIPTLAMRSGDFSAENKIYDPLTTRTVAGAAQPVRDQFPDNKIPASRFDAVMAKMINAYPAPTNSGRVTNYLTNLSQQQNWDQGDVRVDHQFSGKDNFFARWSIQATSTIQPNNYPAVSIPGLPGPVKLGNEDSFAGTSFSPDQHAAASWVHVFSPRLINEARLGFNRFRLDYVAEGVSPDVPLGNLLGVKNSNTNALQSALPIFSPANYQGTGQSRSLPIFRRENTFTYSDGLTFIQGAHTFKFGGEYRRRQITEYQTNRGNGRFNFSPAFTNLPGAGNTGNSMASFLLGYATLIEQDFTLAWIGARGVESGLYAADDFRVSRKLTLNLGLRWDYYSPYSEVANRWANFDAKTATVLIAGVNGVDSRVGVARDFKDFAPRFGFAYQVMPHTVIRGGYGLFYNPNGTGGQLLRLERHVPFGPIYQVVPGDINVGPRVSDGFPAPPIVDLTAGQNPSGAVIGIAPNFRAGYAQQFNLMLQHEIAPFQTVLKAAYVGNLGRRLGTPFNLNQPVPGPGSTTSRRPFIGIRPLMTDVTYEVSDGLSNYSALQLSADKRMSNSVAFQLGYTWAHAIDDTGTEFGGGTGTPQDPRNRRADRGNSASDIRHRFTAGYLFQIPFNPRGVAGLLLGGWRTNGFITVQTGLPFTPGLQTSTTNGTSSRPDGLRDATLPSDQRTLQRWFDASFQTPGANVSNPAFGTPALYTYGSLGRDTLFGPGRVNFDLSLIKDFKFNERVKATFRTEAFNLFNHPQFGQPNASIGNNQAGLISGTVGNARLLQLALRLQF
jgi:hypothetical protein